MSEMQQSRIKAFISAYLREQSGNADLAIDDNTNFVDSGILDSFSILSLIMGLESEYAIKFQPHELAEPSLRTVGGLVQAIMNKAA